MIELFKKKIQDTFMNEATGHDWYHIDRVHRMACYLQKAEGGNLEVIELAALLHDISDHKFNGGNTLASGQIAYRWITKAGGTESLAIHVQEVINSVSFKGAGTPDTTNSIEAKIVQDADRLDALGAIGIARTFAYGGAVGQPIYDPTIPPTAHTDFASYFNGRTHTINHFHEKLLLLAGRLHTKTARKIGNERTKRMQQFLDDFHAEWTNELYL